MGAEVQFYEMKRDLEMDGGDGHTTVNMLNAVELYI